MRYRCRVHRGRSYAAVTPCEAIRAFCILTVFIRRDWPIEEAEPDLLPVVKLFTPDSGCTWPLTEIDPDDEDIAFGFCDLGMGFLELGTVSLSDRAVLPGRHGLPAEHDVHYVAMKSLSACADDAVRAGRIGA